MNFMGTQMHIITFAITAFEVAALFFQIIYYLERPNDRKRLLYLILLISFVLYNVTSGLFPDENIPVPVSIQNVIAYLFAFGTSMYFVYYYYKAFDLKLLRFFATFGSIIFLFVPFLFLFVVPYYITGNLELSRKLTVVIPFLYGIAFIIATTRAFIFKFRVREYSDRIKFQLVLAAYVALLCWVTLPVIVFFGDYQALEHSLTNSGFLIMTIVYIKSSIHQSRKEYLMLIRSGESIERVIETNCGRFNLTCREIEIANLIIKGQSYKLIAYTLNISEKTVTKHVSNIFAKVSATNKVELINKLGQRDFILAQA
ncbi:MAG TPA: helix-turn-helix transcriptional regulator [Cyclobacteriaceae bacterium]|nr:helix-turn-helix transcriptional regulator [Cyclobacteriaceae bacterium]